MNAINTNVVGHRSEDPNALLEDRSFEVHAGNVEELRAQVDKANRKLEKNSIEGRFALRKLGECVEDNEDGTVEVFYVFELDRPELAAINGWTFLAAVELMEGGTFLRVVEGRKMPEGYIRPDAHECQHCGVKRYRNRSFILQHEDGEVRQVGSTCLEAFLGVQVKGLWLLTAFTAEELADLRAKPRPESNGGYVEATYSVRFVIALSHVLTNGGRKFVSRKAAQMEEWKTSTVDDVLATINFRRHGSSQSELAREAQVRDAMIAAQELPAEAVDAVVAAAATIKAGDYADNMMVVLGSEYVGRRALGTLVSLLGVFHRNNESFAESKVEKANEWVGEIKTRLRGMELTVTTMREFDGDYGISTLLVMEDAEGHMFKWFASTTFSFDAGVTLRIDGTVKEHSEWRGRKQTALTRCRIHEVVAA